MEKTFRAFWLEVDKSLNKILAKCQKSGQKRIDKGPEIFLINYIDARDVATRERTQATRSSDDALLRVIARHDPREWRDGQAE